MNDQERIDKAMSTLKGRLRADTILALEALALATEMIPTGGGGTSEVTAGGFESSPPGELNLLAAEVVREGHASMSKLIRHAATLRRKVHAERQMRFHMANAKGRPPIVILEMVMVAKQLLLEGHSVTRTIQAIALEYSVSESALWKTRERGEAAALGSIEREWYEVLSKQKRAE